MASGNDDIVVDSGKETLGDLFRKEDYWAIWLGLALLIVGMIIYLPRPPAGLDESIAKANATMEQESQAPIKTIDWYKANDSKKKLKATSGSHAKAIKKFTSKPGKWSSNPIQAFYMSEEAAAAKKEKATAKYDSAKAAEAAALEKAQASQDAASGAGYNDSSLNEQAKADIAAWRNTHLKASKAKKKTKVKAYNKVLNLILFGLALAVFFGIGTHFMGRSFKEFFIGFLFVFVIAVLAYLISAQSGIKAAGFGYAAWAIILGLIISNTVGTPKWVMPAVQVEYYIKTGLVLLGAEILFGKILTIGIPGIFVAWVVTPIVLLTTFWFGQSVLKMPSKALNITSPRICPSVAYQRQLPRRRPVRPRRRNSHWRWAFPWSLLPSCWW